MDVVANIALAVESKKRVISDYSSCINIAKIISLSSENLGSIDDTVPVYLFATGIIGF